MLDWWVVRNPGSIKCNRREFEIYQDLEVGDGTRNWRNKGYGIYQELRTDDMIKCRKWKIGVCWGVEVWALAKLIRWI